MSKKTLKKFHKRVCKITNDDLYSGHTETELFRNTVEELGEYAAAVTVEKGIKNKQLKESSKIEAVDLIICALSLFYAAGGDDEELANIGDIKLNKWDNRVQKQLAALS